MDPGLVFPCDLRDFFTVLLDKVCNGVKAEPHLTNLNGEELAYKTAIKGDDARADIKARGFWRRGVDAYFDVTDLNKQKNDIFIMGDLNLPNVDWDSGSTRPGCSKNDRDCLTRLGKLMEDHFLIQSVDVPTRKENILDVILTNGNDIVRKISTEDTIMSDHKIVMCYLGYREWVNKVEEVVARTGFNALNLHKADWENINEDLSRVTWQELTTGPVTKDSVAITKSTGFEVFSEKVLEICQNHAPPRSSRQRKNKNKQRALLRKK